MVELKTHAALDAMRVAGRVVAEALAAAREAAAPGVRLLDLDEVARTVLREAGAGSPFLGYRPSFASTPSPPSSASPSMTRSCTASRTRPGCKTATW